MGHAMNKRERLDQAMDILRDHPEGLTRAELARKLDVNRSTINKWLDNNNLPQVYEDNGKLCLLKDSNLARVTLHLNEITMLHIAGRLLVRQTSQHNPYAASALRKLSDVIELTDKDIGEHLAKAADSTDDDQQVRNEAYLQVLRVLTEARARKRKVTVEYEVDDGKWVPYTFSPYFIEPYAPGLTTHVIGFREPPAKIRTFKLERLRNADLSMQDAAPMPADFDPEKLLEYAWGIWYTDEEPELVELKFSKRVQRRVLETRWHRKQEKPQILEDGSVIWRCLIAEPKEMEYWVRGWGSDVEVLKPAELRSRIEHGIRELVKKYNVAELPAVPTYQLLWAKTSTDKEHTHPLICHLIDVGQAALALWNLSFTDSLRRTFAKLMGLENDPDAAGRTIAFWIALHDLGKASPAFQRMYRPVVETLEKTNLVFLPPIAKERVWHATITAVTLENLLPPTLPSRVRRKIAEALGGHHGAWPSVKALSDYRDVERLVGNQEWQNMRAELVSVLETIFQPADTCKLSQDQAEFNTLLTLFSGMTTVADWIGSMAGYFRFASLPVNVKSYSEEAANQAQRALKELSWTDWNPPTQAASFEELFPYLVNGPSPMQQAVIRLAQQLKQPALVIIEAPTGSGKTEAALYLADHWAYHLQQRGLYVAMPTMATSNQMYGRVSEYLQRRYPNQSITPLLIHSQARWMQEASPPEIDTEEESGDFEESESESEAKDMGWFLPRKRSLLASCGVGTVDQALLGVLQTRHFFVRLLGLSHKTIIFDEVHAYDVYMSELFQKLLQWLRAMNVSVVLLSATLPAKKRQELLAAYAGTSHTPPSDIEYPAITWAMNGTSNVVPLPKPKDRRIALHWVDRSTEAIVEKLQDLLSDGGCAAVICNTVARAQKIYDAILDAGLVPVDDLILFHAQTRFGWRQKTEEKVLTLFGAGKDKQQPNPQRPHKAIVVATQVIEQSLDLDFDLLISDLAPIDLLIQRAGRLHRHPQNQVIRRAKLQTPTLIIAASDTGEDLPDMEADGHIYEPELLIRTYLLIHKASELMLPSQTADLIEKVYSDLNISEYETPAIAAALSKAKETKNAHETKAKSVAQGKLILDVANERLLSQTNQDLDEDDPEVNQAFQAVTRLGPRTLSVVCLHEDGTGNLYTEPNNEGMLVKVGQKPDVALTQALAYSTLTISHQGLVNHLLKMPDAKPKGWVKHSLLRHHYILRFKSGIALLPGTDYRLTLDEKIGLRIDKLPKP